MSQPSGAVSTMIECFFSDDSNSVPPEEILKCGGNTSSLKTQEPQPLEQEPEQQQLAPPAGQGPAASFLARNIRLKHGFVCCQWWARALYTLAVSGAAAASWLALEESAMAAAESKASVVLDLVRDVGTGLCRIAELAAGDVAAQRRRSLRLLLAAGFHNEGLYLALSPQLPPSSPSVQFPDGPSYKPRKKDVPAPVVDARLGKTVIISTPHHQHPTLLNNELVCAEVKKKKPQLDDAKIVSHPQRTTLHGMEDLLVDEAVTYAALLQLRRHLDRFTSLRGIPTHLNTTVFQLLGRDEALYEKLKTKTRQNPAMVRYTLRLNPAVHLEQALHDRIRVVEETRRAVREAALSLSLMSVKSSWRDACLVSMKQMTPRHMGEWHALGEVYTGVPCHFPNVAAAVCVPLTAVRPWLCEVFRSFSDPVGKIVVAVLLPMLLGQRDLPRDASAVPTAAARHQKLQPAAFSPSLATIGFYIVPPSLLFALQALAALLYLLHSAIVLHPDGERFLAKLVKVVDGYDDLAVVAFLMADPYARQSVEMSQLAAVGQAVRTISACVEGMTAEDKTALDVTLRCHAQVLAAGIPPPVHLSLPKSTVHTENLDDQLRKLMVGAFEADEALSDQVLAEFLVKPTGTLVRPLRLFECAQGE